MVPVFSIFVLNFPWYSFVGDLEILNEMLIKMRSILEERFE